MIFFNDPLDHSALVGFIDTVLITVRTASEANFLWVRLAVTGYESDSRLFFVRHITAERSLISYQGHAGRGKRRLTHPCIASVMKRGLLIVVLDF